MSIRIGVYDFFANTIPGGLYLGIFIYILISWGILPSSLLPQLSLELVIIIIVAAFILGSLMAPISRVWFRLFKPKNMSMKALTEFKSVHPELGTRIEMRAGIWAILMTHIRRNDPNAIDVIERYSATNIMLNNFSFGLIMLSLSELLLYLRTLWVVHLAIGISALIFSIIAVRESIMFKRWFFSAIYQTASTLEQVIPETNKRKKTTRK